MYQWNRIEILEISSHTHFQLIHDNNGAKNIQWRKDSLQKVVLGNLERYILKNKTKMRTLFYMTHKKEKEVKPLRPVPLFATPWTAARQAPLSVGFSRQEDWSGLPFPSPGDLPNPGIELGSPTLQADALPSEPQGKPYNTKKHIQNGLKTEI